MDSLTQLAFGAAWGEAILGKKVGRKALIWGGVLGTLPDLDVFIHFGGAVNNFVYHRSFSHSLFLLAAISPLLAWLIVKVHQKEKSNYLKWLLLTFTVLESSVLLDLMTVYGTQIFWPFDKTPLAIPVLFIVDPLFTLPILFGIICAFILKSNRSLGHRINSFCLAISILYLVWALCAWEIVNYNVKKKLHQQNIQYTEFIATPSPFNTLLWRVVGIYNGRYFETYYSILDSYDDPLKVNFHSRKLKLYKGIETLPSVEKLEIFTRGYYSFSELGSWIVMTDLRMGSEPDYIFSFKVAKLKNGFPVQVEDEKLKAKIDRKRLGWVWNRIWTPNVYRE